MLFGRKPRKGRRERKWWLAGAEIQETESYKYLGVDLVSRVNFKKMKERYVAQDVGVRNGDERRGVACSRLLQSLECACKTCA